MPIDLDVLDQLPAKPGVYLMKDKNGSVLYIGKAKNILIRVKQYFFPGRDQRAMIPFLVSKVEKIETILVTSEKEALLLENNLIKQYKPRYNALLKDDKSFIALKINHKHQWPMVSVVRYKGKPKADGIYFGPFTSAYAARDTLDLLHRLFPLRQCSDQELARRTRPCILYDIKRCIAPCVGKCTKEEYQTQLEQTIDFLKGNDKEVLKDLKMEMQKASDTLNFEKADEILKKIRNIEKTIEKQLVDKPLGIDLDAIGIYRQGDCIQIALMFYRGGKLSGLKHFSFENIAQENEDLLVSFLMQHYTSEIDIPTEILVPFSFSEQKNISEIFSTAKTKKVKILCPNRGEKIKLIEMANKNAESIFSREKDAEEMNEKSLLELKERLNLTNYPTRIECIDNSSLSGTEPVSAIVVFRDGKEDKSHYRKYKIKAAKPGDDYGAMYEVLMRRYSKLKDENHLPDLLVVDGGKGQLNVALRVFKDLNIISVDVISLVKEKGRHDKGATRERVFLTHTKESLSLPKTSLALFLLQKIRDEAHRFAIAFQRKRRSKKSFESVLETIPGIGKTKRKNLLKYLGSLKRVKEATLEDLMEVPKISKKDAAVITDFFQQYEHMQKGSE